MARGRVIGRQGAIPWHLPSDLANFKRLTWGHPIIMGRSTFLSLGKVLPGRTNIILSRKPGWAVCGGIVCASLEQALELIADAEECFIIGGARVYAEALPFIQRQYLSLLHIDVTGDAYYPELCAEQWTVRKHVFYQHDRCPWSYLELERCGESEHFGKF